MIDFGLGTVRLWGATVACANLLTTHVAGAHPAPFTIKDVMQAPFPSELRAASAGRAVAWVFDAKGVRNVWVADSPGAVSAHPVTSFTGDDGFNIGDLAWSPEGKRLAFVSHRGSHPIIGVYDVADRSIVWMTPTFDYDSFPTFSPDGTRIAFVHVLAEKVPAAFLSRRSGR